jgi:uncharacterized protein (TIGR02271 family)
LCLPESGTGILINVLTNLVDFEEVMNMNKHVEVYDNENQVLQRIEELKSQGISEDHIYLVVNRNERLSILKNRTDLNIDEATTRDTHTEEKGFFAKFVDSLKGEDETNDSFERMDLTGHDRERYAQEVREGKILLYVDKDYQYGYETDRDRDLDRDRVLDRDLDRDRVLDRDLDRDRVDTEKTIGLREERLNVDKEQVKAGEVKVSKHVEEERASIDVPVKEEEVYVERRKVDDPHRASAGDVMKDGEEVVVPVSEEKVHVNKDQVVAEEVAIGKRDKERTEHVEETLKKEKVDIDKGGKVVVDKDKKKI